MDTFNNVSFIQKRGRVSKIDLTLSSFGSYMIGRKSGASFIWKFLDVRESQLHGLPSNSLRVVRRTLPVFFSGKAEGREGRERRAAGMVQ